MERGIQRQPHFTELAAKFDYETQFVSSPDGMRSHPSFQQIVEIGEEAIPDILRRLQHLDWKTRDLNKPSDIPRSPWLALAIDEITGQNITGYAELAGNVDAIVERTLTWGEENSLVELRPEKAHKASRELYVLLRNALISNAVLRKSLAIGFLNGSENVGFMIGNRTVIVSKPEEMKEDESGIIYLTTYKGGQRAPTELYVEFYESDHESSSFDVSGTNYSTREAERRFRQMVEEIFGPQPPPDYAYGT